jgi:hypothetical protein
MSQEPKSDEITEATSSIIPQDMPGTVDMIVGYPPTDNRVISAHALAHSNSQE